MGILSKITQSKVGKYITGGLLGLSLQLSVVHNWNSPLLAGGLEKKLVNPVAVASPPDDPPNPCSSLSEPSEYNPNGIIKVGWAVPYITADHKFVYAGSNVDLSQLSHPPYNPIVWNGLVCVTGCALSELGLRDVAEIIQNEENKYKITLSKQIPWVNPEGEIEDYIGLDDMIASIRASSQVHPAYSGITVEGSGYSGTEIWVYIKSPKGSPIDLGLSFPVAPAESISYNELRTTDLGAGITRLPTGDLSELVTNLFSEEGETYRINSSCIWIEPGEEPWAGINVRAYPENSEIMKQDLINGERHIIFMYPLFNLSELQECTPALVKSADDRVKFYYVKEYPNIIVGVRTDKGNSITVAFRTDPQSDSLFSLKDDEVNPYLEYAKSISKAEFVRIMKEDYGRVLEIYPDHNWAFMLQKKPLIYEPDNTTDNKGEKLPQTLPPRTVRFYQGFTDLQKKAARTIADLLEATGVFEVEFVDRIEDADAGIPYNSTSTIHYLKRTINNFGIYNPELQEVLNEEPLDLDKLASVQSTGLMPLGVELYVLYSADSTKVFFVEPQLWTGNTSEFYRSLRLRKSD